MTLPFVLFLSSVFSQRLGLGFLQCKYKPSSIAVVRHSCIPKEAECNIEISLLLLLRVYQKE